MSFKLKEFFKLVTADKHLQEKLFNTSKLTEVSDIAKEYGYDVAASDILRAQARRALLISADEQQMLANGQKAVTCGQWGRDNKGYIDYAGYWLNQFIVWRVILPANEPELQGFIELIIDNIDIARRVGKLHSCNAVAAFAKTVNFHFDGVLLLKYLASQVLMLDEEKLAQLLIGGMSAADKTTIAS